MKLNFSFWLLGCAINLGSITASCSAAAPIVLEDKISVAGREIDLRSPPIGLVARTDLGLLTVAALNGQVVYRTDSRILETRATITPKGDYLLMFPEGVHYGAAKGEKLNTMRAFRSSDRGKTWVGSSDPFKIDYNQHGFIPFIPKGSNRIYAFGTQPIPALYSWKNGQQENAPIGYRFSDDDGFTWSPLHLISPVNDPSYVGMSVMRMTETPSGVWLLGSHTADWSQKPLRTRQYILRSTDQGKTWTLLPGARPDGWYAPGFDRMDEGRPISLGGKEVFFMSRTAEGHLWSGRSLDDGLTWTIPTPTPLVQPDAPPMLFLLSDGRTLVAFHHNRSPVDKTDKMRLIKEGMKVRSEIWFALSPDGGRSWSSPRFLFANAAIPNLPQPSFNYQCSYLDCFEDGAMLHIFLPHRWQQALHLTIKEADLRSLAAAASTL